MQPNTQPNDPGKKKSKSTPYSEKKAAQNDLKNLKDSHATTENQMYEQGAALKRFRDNSERREAVGVDTMAKLYDKINMSANDAKKRIVVHDLVAFIALGGEHDWYDDLYLIGFDNLYKIKPKIEFAKDIEPFLAAAKVSRSNLDAYIAKCFEEDKKPDHLLVLHFLSDLERRNSTDEFREVVSRMRQQEGVVFSTMVRFFAEHFHFPAE